MKDFWSKRFPLHLVIGKRFFVPANLNTWYVLGGLLMFSLMLQLLTGLWLTMFYMPSAGAAFASIQTLMRQVPAGWLLRTLHSTGASAIFVLVYLHMFRGILYRSYQSPREVVWLLGVILFWLLLAEAFLGYLLPWGQMSYWGAVVVTNIIASVPWGNAIVTWLRGDYVISGITLQRFFAWHIIAVPLLLAWVVRLHIKALHHVGSGNPGSLPIDTREHKGVSPAHCVAFYPHQFRKDFIACLYYLCVFCAVVFFVPRGFGLLLDAVNEQPADFWHTPSDIRPLWYMAPYYALLRAIPSKIGGLMVMGFALVSLAGLPWLGRLRSLLFKAAPSGLVRAVFLSVAVGCFIGLVTMGLLPLYAWLPSASLGFAIIGFVALLLSA